MFNNILLNALYFATFHYKITIRDNIVSIQESGCL